MGLVMAVISGKGGVGKTTASANIALGLALNGKKCAVVDFDIGQRNLDLILGLEQRVVYNLVQVMDGEATLNQALIQSRASSNLHFLAASQTHDKSVLDSEKIKRVVEDLKEEFDMVILDAPAGIESGFEHTIEFADSAIVVVNPEVSSLRDADRAIGILDSKSQRVKEGHKVTKYLVINRIVPEMVATGDMLNSDHIIKVLSIKLLGKVPEDNLVIEASNRGTPVVLDEESIAGQSYMRIAKRLCGETIDIVDVEKFTPQPGLMNRIKKGIFGK